MTGRYLKYQVHEEFDKLWKEGLMTRGGAYKYLQYLMGIVNHEEAHISKLSPEQCGSLLKRLRNPYLLKSFFVFCNQSKFTLPKKKRERVPRSDEYLYMRICPIAPFVKYDKRELRFCKLCGTLCDAKTTKKNIGCEPCRVKTANRKLVVLNNWATPSKTSLYEAEYRNLIETVV